MLLAVLLAVIPVWADREGLFVTGPRGRPTDTRTGIAAAAELKRLGLVPADHILVLNRNMLTYIASGALPSSRYFHPLHLLCSFMAPDPDPLGEALKAHPRFMVVSDPDFSTTCERPDRWARVNAFLAANYRLAGEAKGTWDSVKVYELAGR